LREGAATVIAGAALSTGHRVVCFPEKGPTKMKDAIEVALWRGATRTHRGRVVGSYDELADVHAAGMWLTCDRFACRLLLAATS